MVRTECMLPLISFVIAYSSCEAREESENSKTKKFFPTVGLEPITLRFLDWRSNQLRHGTTLIVNI